MRFIRRFWYLIAVFILLLAATFLVQATENNVVSKFLIDWAGVWSTFIGALATVLIVIMAVAAYWQERNIRLWAIKDKIDGWVKDIYKVLGVAEMWRGDLKTLNEQQHKEIMAIIVESLRNITEISRLVEKHTPDIKEEIHDIGVKLVVLRGKLSERVVDRGEFWEIFHSIADDVEEILKHNVL